MSAGQRIYNAHFAGTDNRALTGATMDFSPIAYAGLLMPASGVTPGTYGHSTLTAQFTVDASGRITSATEVSVAGGGTVTSFSAGNLAPLFTSSVATATSTPALTFALSNQDAKKVLIGPATGAAAAPTFRLLAVADIPTGLPYLSSVGVSMPAVFAVTGSPLTTNGTIAISWATNSVQNKVLASPDGSTGAISLRSLVAADLGTTMTPTFASAGNAGTGVISGNAFVGTWNDINTYAVVSHKNFQTTNSGTGYAFIQDATGNTYFNAATGGNLSFAIGGTTQFRLGTTGGLGIGTTYKNIDPGMGAVIIQTSLAVGVTTNLSPFATHLSGGLFVQGREAGTFATNYIAIIGSNSITDYDVTFADDMGGLAVKPCLLNTSDGHNNYGQTIKHISLTNASNHTLAQQIGLFIEGQLRGSVGGGTLTITDQVGLNIDPQTLAAVDAYGAKIFGPTAAGSGMNRSLWLGKPTNGGANVTLEVETGGEAIRFTRSGFNSMSLFVGNPGTSGIGVYDATAGVYLFRGVQSTGDFEINGKLTTGAPNGGTAAAWKLGVHGVGCAQIDIAGTLYNLVTTEGVFGGLYIHDGTTAQSITNGFGTTYTQLTGFNTAQGHAGQATNTTPSTANSKITVGKTGKYFVAWAVSGTAGTANLKWACAAFAAGAEIESSHGGTKILTNTDLQEMSGCGFVSITSLVGTGGDIDLRMTQDGGAAANFTPVFVNLTVQRVGD